MKFSVGYHPQTYRDFEAIADWLTDYAGVEGAMRRISEIQEACERLADFPDRGAPRDEIYPGLKMVPAADGVATVSYVVDVIERELTIITVKFAGGDWESASRARLKLN